MQRSKLFGEYVVLNCKGNTSRTMFTLVAGLRQVACPSVTVPSQTATLMASRITCNLVWERLHRLPSDRDGVCWCRSCTIREVPGPYGSPGWELFVPEGQTCCTEAWLARGWFCRWCGKDETTGYCEAASGIYGGLFWDVYDHQSYCECGWELHGWTNLSLASCGSCHRTVGVSSVADVRPFVGSCPGG